MPALDRILRNQLERSVRSAREIAETAARVFLEQLAVDKTKPYKHLGEEEKKLRRRLRAHGRQLGDSLGEEKVQSMELLVEETAYEHWHRMLFARFLAENHLLMYPDPDEPVPITLEECNDLAAEEGAANGWELAARFAAQMLPQIFRPDSPVFRLSFPPEHQQSLERLLTELPTEIFTASDSLGWVYQFWQAKRKDEVNASEVKIGARELPAVTQLFTEPYMVDFLLDNSLGAWWVGKVAGLRREAAESDELIPGARQILQTAETEDELRAFFSLPTVPLQYLRFVRAEEKGWEPAAGNFAAWPDELSELKVLDPCCGSGHFLVAAFLMLVPLRMKLEGLTAREASDAVLRENIHGLELDQRCVALAAFALALTVWTYPGAGGYRVLPELNIACSGLSVSVAKEEWRKLGQGDKNLSIALGSMHDSFEDAPVLGSLINPAKSDAAKLVGWNKLHGAIERALELELSDEQLEAAVVAHGLAKAAILLAETYHLVITNVPYLARGRQSEQLREFCDLHYSEAKNDLATVFLERCLELCVYGGTCSLVLPQNWLFLTRYKQFRKELLENHTWNLIARLGEGGFDSSAAAGAFTILINISRGISHAGISTNKGQQSFFSEADLHGSDESNHLMHGLDVSEIQTAIEKASQLMTTEIKSVEQAKQLENPDARIILEDTELDVLLKTYANSYQGLASADYARFGRFHWEILNITGNADWVYQQSTTRNTCHYSGKQCALYWQCGAGELALSPSARIQGLEAWEKNGIAAAQMRDINVTLHTGSSFDNNTAVIVPRDQANLPALWCFCSSPEYNEAVRQIDQSLKVTNATLAKVPFDLEHWTKVAEEKYPHGLPKPYTDDPTQWLFHGHPCGSVVWNEEKKWTAHGPLRTDETVLHIAVARLLGYRWPAELDEDMELADEQREWVKRSESLSSYADLDGIVCIPPVRGEARASERLLNLLAASYGDAWSSEILATLLKNADHAGKTLESWLRDKFFSQHLKLFQQRPFIWQIWDGLRDGFSVLVNYHMLDRKKLEALIYTYLGDWIMRQKRDQENKVDGAGERLAAAESLKTKLELILEGERPYDIFVRWKPLSQQPSGWNPDLNDGVRLNIRPFMTVPDVRYKGAGCLRNKPNINWNKDRGRDVESAPWYELGPKYGGLKGDRINDHHLSLAEKRAAREALT